jgi:LmbE family N-acetylglucosaminyl deacetylase
MSPRKVLAVGARPLDVEFHAAGSLAHLARSGANASLLICSEAVPGAGVTDLRRDETSRGAAAVGVKEVVFLDAAGGANDGEAGLRRELVRWIRREQPELVLCPDPTTYWIEHEDHTYLVESECRRVGKAVLDALHPRTASRAAYQDLGREGLRAWLVPQVWLFGSDRPNHFVDISGTHRVKCAALSCHESEGALRLMEEAEAEAWRHEQGFMAEAFHRLRLL